MNDKAYDLFVIGGGSGSVRAARTAAGLGATVAVAESRHLGGTCVNVGCVPKKLFVYAAQFREEFAASAGFGWSAGEAQFDWSRLILQKNREIDRLQAVYHGLLDQAGVDVINGRARLLDAHTVAVGDRQFRCRHILIASGGRPAPLHIPGGDYAANSDAMFALEHLPKRILIIGGGYIAVEFAGIMRGLGVHTTLSYRGARLLRGFDEDIREFAGREMAKRGVEIRLNSRICRIEKSPAGLLAVDETGHIAADLVLAATGRIPNTAGLGLEVAGVALDDTGAIRVDAEYRTTVPSVFALGDVTNRVRLTPVATAEGAALANRLFGGQATTVDYRLIPTAVFGKPNIGTVGLTETEARAAYGEIDVYKSEFTPLKHALSGLGERTLMKMVVERSSGKVLGVHMAGAEAGEIVQGLAVALRAGATKAVFDSTLGIHPTVAEEFVTMRTPVP